MHEFVFVVDLGFLFYSWQEEFLQGEKEDLTVKIITEECCDKNKFDDS